MAFYSDDTITWDRPKERRFFHGTQQQLELLRAGSSVTRNEELAKAFAHRPSAVWSQRQGEIGHDGTEPGFLYVVAEPLTEEDWRVHPACREDDPWELVLQRDVKVRLLQWLPAPQEAEDRRPGVPPRKSL